MWIIPGKFFNKLLDILFPEKCLGCGEKNTYLCPTCRLGLPGPQNFNKNIMAAVSYHSKLIKKAVHGLKYRKAGKIARPLARLMLERIDFSSFANEPERTVIIPVPLSMKRFRQRGFNQAELLAKHLSDRLNVRMLNNVLYKNKHTVSQVEIKNREKRLNNLKGAFSAKNHDLIKNKTVLLIDDVSTTGATIREAARILKKYGAGKVIGAVVASG